jgi:hypothetical protein
MRSCTHAMIYCHMVIHQQPPSILVIMLHPVMWPDTPPQYHPLTALFFALHLQPYFYSNWVFNAGRNGRSLLTQQYIDPYGVADFEYVDFVNQYSSDANCQNTGVCPYDMAIVKLKTVSAAEDAMYTGKKGRGCAMMRMSPYMSSPLHLNPMQRHSSLTLAIHLLPSM